MENLLATARSSGALCGLLQDLMVAVPLGAGCWPFLRDLSRQDARKGGECCLCFSRRKNAGPFGTISLSGSPTEGTRWRTRLKVHSLHWIRCSHNNTLHRSRRAARPFDGLLTHCGPVNVNVMRTPSGLNGGCDVGGWMVAVSARPFEASRSKGAVSGVAAFRGGKTLPRSVQSLWAEVQLRGHDAGPDLRAAHFRGYLARITTHCTGAAGPRGLLIVY